LWPCYHASNDFPFDNLRILALANKARDVAMKITTTGIEHQEAMKEALEINFNDLQKMLGES